MECGLLLRAMSILRSNSSTQRKWEHAQDEDVAYINSDFLLFRPLKLNSLNDAINKAIENMEPQKCHSVP